MICIGTSGYSYDDWKGNFYNPDIKKSDMLEEYSKSFRFTEINSTYYSMPNRYMFINLVKKTPQDFKFTIKLHGSMTHARDADAGAYSAFNEAIRPVIDSNKMGCLVAQFPYSFHNNIQNVDCIKKIRDNFDHIPLCVEFRNDKWNTAETYKVLSQYDMGYICVDEPNIKGLVKRVSVVTSKVGYVRFHGRNSNKWYNHKESYERYDYLYSEDELKEWLPRIEFIHNNTEVTFIAFNNHFRAQGAVNASMLQCLLEKY